MYCTKCGKQINDSARFCTSCGAPVTEKPNTAKNGKKITTTNDLSSKSEQKPSQKPTVKTESNKKNGFFSQILAEAHELFKHPKKLIPTFVLAVLWLVMPLVTGFSAGANIPIVRFICTLTYANGGILGGFFGTVGGIFGKAVFAAVVNSLVLSLCAKKNPFKNFKKGIGGVFTGGLKAIAPLLWGAGAGLILYWLFNITSAPQNSAIAIAAAIAAIQAVGKQNGLLFGGGFYLLKKLTKGKAPTRITVSRLITGLAAGFTVGFGLTFIRYAWMIVLGGILLLVSGIGIKLIGENGVKKAAATAALVLIIGGIALPFTAIPAYAIDLPDNYVEPKYIDGFSLGGDISNVGDYDGFYLELESVYSYLFENAAYRFVGISDNKDLLKIKFNPVKVNLARNKDVPSFNLSGSCKFTEQGEKISDEYDYSGVTYVMDYSFSVTVDFEEWEYNRALFRISGTERIKYDVGDTSQEETCVIDGELDSDNCVWRTSDDDSSKHYLSIYSNRLSSTGLGLSFRILGVLPAGKSGYVGGKTGSAKGEDGYVPYRGRLTYTSGIVNKHGQPFPDIMDFNNDGYIDYEDLAIRQKLVHNPDYLDTPQGALLAVVTVITTTAGAAAGVVSSAAGTGSALGGLNLNVEFPEDEENTHESKEYEDMVKQTDKYISTDDVGDLTVRDPVTGAEKHYARQKDGSYRQIESGQSYTKDEIRNDIAYVQRNSEYFSDTESKRAETEKYQREHASDLSEDGKKMAEMMREEKEEQAYQDYINEVGKCHGIYSGDESEIREKLGTDQASEEKSNERLHRIADNIDTTVKVAELTQTAADVSLDALETATGATGKAINSAYKVTKGAVSKGAEAYVKGEDVTTAALHGATEGGIDAAAGSLKGGYKAGATVAGETAKAALDAYVKGKDVAEAAKQGMKTGVVNAAADGAFDYVGGKVNEAGSADISSKITNASSDEAARKLASMPKKLDAANSVANNLTKNCLNNDDTSGNTGNGDK